MRRTPGITTCALLQSVGCVCFVTEAFTKHFIKYGEIVDSVIMKHKGTGRPRGFGFITFADPAVIDNVLSDDHVIDGRTVRRQLLQPSSTDLFSMSSFSNGQLLCRWKSKGPCPGRACHPKAASRRRRSLLAGCRPL